MSWRVSFYRANKEQPLIIKQTDEDDYEDVDINGEEIINNEGTQVWQDMSEEERNNHDLFVDLRPDDEDWDIFLVTKKGLELFIRKYEKENAEMFKNLMNPSDAEWEQVKEGYFRRKFFEWSQHFAVERDLDKIEFKVTNSSYWEYTVFNLIHLYKSFDFEKYALVLWGG